MHSSARNNGDIESLTQNKVLFLQKDKLAWWGYKVWVILGLCWGYCHCALQGYEKVYTGKHLIMAL